MLNIYGILQKGVMHKCLQMTREKPTAFASRDSWKNTGMKSMKRGGKGTLKEKRAAVVHGAGKN